MNFFKKNKIYIILVIIFFISSFYLFFNNYFKSQFDSGDFILYDSGKVFLEINDQVLEGGIKKQNETVASLMFNLKDENIIDFNYVTYVGLGVFINEINGIRSSNLQNWIYYVNGEKASVGVSNYKLKNGDVVTWKYEKLIN